MRRFALCLVLVAGTCSCVSLRGPSDLRRDIVRETGWRLQRETAFGLGRLPLRLVGSLIEDGDGNFSLRGLTRMEVGVYLLETHASKRSLRGLKVRGFEPIVRVSEADSDAAILVDDSDDMRELIVISRDAEEVVIVRVKGRVDTFLERMFASVAEEGKGWGEVTRETAQESLEGTG